MSGMEFGADTAICLPLRSSTFVTLSLAIDPVRHHNPVAPKQFDVAALGVGREDALRPAFEAVEFAGDQRLEGKLIVLELRNLDL